MDRGSGLRQHPGMHVALFRIRTFLLLCVATFALSVVTTGCKESADADKDNDEEEAKDDDEEEEDDKKKRKKKKKKKEPVFTRKKPSVGDKRTENKTETMDMRLNFMKQDTHIVSKKEEIVVEEVLALGEDGVITKLKVTYKKHSETEDKDGKAKTTTGPVEGKTYIVERKGDQVVVTDGSGNKVPADEEAIVKKDNKRLGKPKAMDNAIPERPLKKGERVPELEVALQVDFAARSADDDDKKKPTFEGMKVTFREWKGDHGFFDVEMTMKLEKEGLMVMTFPFKGSFKVRKQDGWPAEIQMTADLTVAPPAGGKGGMKGNGKMTMKTVNTY